MNYGDIVLIDHYTTAGGDIKARPALVVSSDDYNTREIDRILIPITSNITRPCPDDLVLRNDDTAFPLTGLKVPSAIRVGKILTAHKDLIKRKIGHLSSDKMTEVNTIIRQILNL